MARLGAYHWSGGGGGSQEDAARGTAVIQSVTSPIGLMVGLLFRQPLRSLLHSLSYQRCSGQCGVRWSHQFHLGSIGKGQS